MYSCQFVDYWVEVLNIIHPSLGGGVSVRDTMGWNYDQMLGGLADPSLYSEFNAHIPTYMHAQLTHPLSDSFFATE